MEGERTDGRRWLAVGAVGLALLLAAYALPVGQRLRAGVYAVVTVGLLVGATLASGWRAKRSQGPERVAWVLLALAALSWGLGEAGWEVLEVGFNRTPPTPHWTDVPYLLNVPLTVAGVLALAWRPGTVGQTWSRVVDALFVAAALLFVGWILFLEDALASNQAHGLGAAVAIAYPIGDIAILTAFSLTLVRLDRDRLRQLWPLLAGLAVVAVSDAAFTWILLGTGGYSWSWFDLGWSLGAFGILWAALRPGRPGLVHQGPAGHFEQWLPIGAACLALGTGIVDLRLHGPFDALTMTLGLAAATLLLVRQVLLTTLHLELLRNLSESQRLAGLARWRWLRGSNLIDLGERGPALWGLPEERTAVPVAELSGRLHPDDRPRFEAAWASLLAGSADLDLTVRVADPQGERHLQLRALRDRNLQGTLLDVTTQSRFEQERTRAEFNRAEAERYADLARAKTQFINTAAHELSTPLTPIRLSLATLRSGRPTRGDPLALLERNVERLTRLLQDVLDGARLQSDRLRLELRPMDLSELIHAVAEEHQPTALAKAIQLDVDAPVPVVVLGDATRLHEVVMNLLNNALKFTPTGGRVQMTVRKSADQASLSVLDTGRGLSAADLQLLFQPFTQVGTNDQEGTGLGLYIVKGIVERHNGNIRAESAGPGQGSCFTVDLPLALQAIVPAP